MKKVDDALVMALAAGASVADAARHARLSERTARRRLQDPAFRSRVDAARRELVTQVVGRLSAVGVLAGDTLHGLVRSAKSESVKLGACRAVLEFMFKGQELQVVARQVEELQRRIEEMANGSCDGQGAAGPAAGESGGAEPGEGQPRDPVGAPEPPAGGGGQQPGG
jgi:hypothetical protein